MADLPTQLLERDAHLAAIDAAIASVLAGAGAPVTISGPPGIGKTTLLDAARSRCGEAGLELFSAAGDLALAGEPHGVAAALLAPLLAGAQGAHPGTSLRRAAAVTVGAVVPAPGEATGSPQAALALLRDVVFERAQERPIALLVDDAHWADAASTAWLGHLGARLAAHPVLLVLALRECDEPMAFHGLGDQPDAASITLAALSAASTTALLRERLGGVDPAFAAAAHRACSGRPFLVHELVRTLADAGIPPTADAAVRIAALPATGLAHACLLRLARARPAARALARAAAVLGPDATLETATCLAELEPPEAALAASELRTIAVLAPGEPLPFVHPLVRHAVLLDIPGPELACLHTASGRLLAERGAAPDRVATHLLEVAPAGDAWAAARLEDAAAAALARGAFGPAAQLAGRALEEPPAPTDRPRGALLLGTALARDGRPDEACGPLQAALAHADGAELRRAAAVELLGALADTGRADAMAAFSNVVGDADRELQLLLEAPVRPGEPPAFAATRLACWAGLDGVTPGERAALAALGHARAAAGAGHAAAVAAVTRPALQPEPARPAPPPPEAADEVRFVAGLALSWCEAPDPVPEPVHPHGPARAGLAWLAAERALAGLELGAASAQARAALELAAESPQRGADAAQAARSVLARVAALRGDDDVLARWTSPALPLGPCAWPSSDPRLAGALHAERAGRSADAAALLAAHGARCEDTGWTNPAAAGWRTDLVRVLVTLGDTAQAAAHAEIAVGRATAFAAPGALGRALAARALLEEPATAMGTLERAVTLLSACRLDRARALLALGRAQGEVGDRARAREPLRRALDLARAGGASALAAEARVELRRTGARVRRGLIAGRDALTPAEERVAKLVADGLTNREVAHRLHVTLRTVEMHLTSAYGKLGIPGRRELAGALT